MIRSLAAVALALALATPSVAQPTRPPAPDYARAEAWLCRPDRNDPCAAPLDTTAVAATGATTVATPTAPATPPIDCFYVYPTVSTDPGPVSDASLDGPERYVARVQFAPLRAACRPFAPLYRQATLAALRTAFTGGAPVDFAAANADIAAAWTDYLERDNKGRGVILIGHSQGARLLKTLLQRIEGGPESKPVVATYLIGTNILVPTGKDVGGDFRATPLCRSATQTGCVVSYVSFRADAPPPATARFGRAPATGQAVACVNPGAPGGGTAALDPRFPNRAPDAALGAPTQGVTWATGVAVTTPFVTAPGLLSAACVDAGGAQYLAVATAADPTDPRLDRIPGDTVVMGQVMADWGLHLIDMNVAMGNLVALARAQGAAWLKGR